MFNINQMISDIETNQELKMTDREKKAIRMFGEFLQTMWGDKNQPVPTTHSNDQGDSG